MKKLYFLLFALLISAAGFGQVILADGFDYPDGSLVANSAWTQNTGTAGTFLVSSGQAVVDHSASEDVRLSFSAVTGDIYAAFDFSVDDLGSPFGGTDFEYFAHMGFNSRIDLVAPSSTGDFTVGISTNTSTAQATWGTDLNYGQTYRIVVKYDQVGGVAQLWVGPATEADTSISGDVDTTPGTITSIDFRQSTSSNSETVRVDNLMVGQTFNDVLVFMAPTNPTITITAPSNGSVLDPGTSSVDLTWTTTNTTGSESVTVTINGTATTNAMSPFSIATADGETYNVTVELIDGSVLDSDMSSFSVASITSVATIAEIRAGSTGDFFELVGEAVVSYVVTEGTRNQKYIQDATGGILIDDTAGTLSIGTTAGDGLTGLKGELSQFSGVLQFIPSEDLPGTSSTGNTITPQLVGLADFVANGEDYESELIQIFTAEFAVMGTFADNTNYDISNGTDMGVLRVSFGDEDIIGTAIPTSPVSIIGLGGQFNSTYQILPRFASDVNNMALSNDEFSTSSFSLYPNPTSEGYVNISTVSNDDVNVAVYDILGKQVINETLSNERLDVSNLKSGVYLLKIKQNEATVTKKLVIN